MKMGQELQNHEVEKQVKFTKILKEVILKPKKLPTSDAETPFFCK
jgi:hypothetical protein